jgi:hypothetical protein
MNLFELQQLNTDSYKLATNYCRTLHGKGGVCIYLHINLNVVNTDLKKYCKDKDFEVYAIKLCMNSNRFCIITIYRAPTGSTDTFTTKLDLILRNCTPESKNLLLMRILI